MIDFARARRMMVDCQLRTFDITDIAVLAAFDGVARETFIPADRAALAYSDTPLALGRRTLLAPMVLARMIQALEVRSGEKALTVGGGTGYGAAILAWLGADVVAVENDHGLVEHACAALEGRALAVEGPLAEGHAPGAPYDLILVEGGVQTSPDRLLGQLGESGRLICIDATTKPGRVTRYVRSQGHVGARSLFDAAAPVLDGFEKQAAFVF